MAFSSIISFVRSATLILVSALIVFEVFTNSYSLMFYITISVSLTASSYSTGNDTFTITAKISLIKCSSISSAKLVNKWSPISALFV